VDFDAILNRQVRRFSFWQVGGVAAGIGKRAILLFSIPPLRTASGVGGLMWDEHPILQRSPEFSLARSHCREKRRPLFCPVRGIFHDRRVGQFFGRGRACTGPLYPKPGYSPPSTPCGKLATDKRRCAQIFLVTLFICAHLRSSVTNFCPSAFSAISSEAGGDSCLNRFLLPADK